MYRVQTTFSGTPVNGGGVQHFYFSEPAGTAAQAHSAVVTFWQGIANNMSNTLSFTVEGEVELVDEADGHVTGITSVSAVSGTGNLAGDILPPATQGLIRWRTGAFVDGREIRGRTFLPAMLEANSTLGVPLSAITTSFTSYGSGLIANATSELLVYSRTLHASATVVTASTWTKWAQLRSRRD